MSFTSIQKIRFDDVDGAGIVYYPQFFHLCHAAFEDFFDSAAPVSYPDLISKRRRGFPTVALQSQFIAPLTYGDIAIIQVAIRRMGRASVVFAYKIRRKHDGALCFEAEVTTVFTDLDAMKGLPLEDTYKNIFNAYLEDSQTSVSS